MQCHFMEIDLFEKRCIISKYGTHWRGINHNV